MNFLEWLFSFLGTPKEEKVTTVVTKERPPWAKEMLRAYGKHEIRDYDWLMTWLISDGKRLGDIRQLPWCGDGMETAVKVSLPNEKFTGALLKNPYWARNWLYFGVPCLPQQYCIGVFSRKKGGHVGIIIGEDETHYHVLGANQGDSVSIVRIEKVRLLGCRWPKTYPMPTKIEMPKLSSNVAVSVNEV